jgi:adenylate cyclase
MIIIVVDDEEGVRLSLKKVLEREGNTILLAADGNTAIDIVRTNGRDIETVISDYKMPGLDGLETLIAIGQINPEITRIMLTGYATMESAIEAVNAGIEGFLTKPFDNNELRAKVREYNIKKRLKQFVSEPVLKELQKDSRSILPRRQTVSVLFVDIRNFSTIAAKLNPADLSDLLNVHYFSPLDSIIYEQRGTLDKHIGDGIMGIFGAPVQGDDDARRAVQCAIRMREAMKKINEDLGANGRRLSIGIGIGTGEVMAGIFGSSKKKEYTVLGHPVNLAARLEHLAKEDQILICEETCRRIGGAFRVEKMKPSGIKGISEPVDIYSVIGENG